MKDYFAEFLYVFAHSHKTHAALILGMVFSLIIVLMGEFYVSRLHFEGVYAGLEQAIIPRIMRHYDKAALGILISSWALAFKCYRRDKRRLL